MRDASPKQQTNSKYKLNQPANRITTSHSLTNQRKIKQTNKKTQNKSHPKGSLHKHWNNLQRAETKRMKEFNLEAWENEISDKVKKIIILKRQRNTTQMKEQNRKTEVKTNEEDIGKLSEKEFRIMIVKMIKTLENNGENARIS